MYKLNVYIYLLFNILITLVYDKGSEDNLFW